MFVDKCFISFHFINYAIYYISLTVHTKHITQIINSKYGYLPDGSLKRSDRDMCVILLNNVMVDLLLEPFPDKNKLKLDFCR